MSDAQIPNSADVEVPVPSVYPTDLQIQFADLQDPYGDAGSPGPFGDETVKFEPDYNEDGGGGDISTHPFKVFLSVAESGVWSATIEQGFIFKSDLTFEPPNGTLHAGFNVPVSNGEYVAIKQTEGVTAGEYDYSLAIIPDDTGDLITTASGEYYADETIHLVAKIVVDATSTATPKPLIVEQYITTNLVRAISTHSGSAYYRLLPK